MKIKRTKVRTPKVDSIAINLARHLEHNGADHSIRLAFLNATRDEQSCPQGLLNTAWNLVYLAQVILENAEYAAQFEDKANAELKGTDEEVQSLRPFIKDFDKALQSARDEVAGNVPLS